MLKVGVFLFNWPLVRAKYKSMAKAVDSIKAEVKITEPLGGDMLVDTSVGKEKVLVKTKPDFTATMGQEGFLNFDKQRWHVFSSETGLAFF